MLMRLGFVRKNTYSSIRRFFSSAAFNNWSERIQKLENEYPGLYSSSFIDEQKELIRTRDSSLSNWLNDYNEAREDVFKQSKEDVFIKLDEDTVRSITPRPNRTTIQEKNVFEERLKQGTEYVQNILRLQESEEQLSPEQKNLKMIELAEWGDKLDQWKTSLAYGDRRGNDLGLPISDTELDQWAADQFVKSPMFQPKSEEEQQWMQQLDERLIEYLKKKNPDLDEQKWREFNNICNEVFHPHKIDHYSLHDFSKSLFRAALWQSPERLENVEKDVERLQSYHSNAKDDDVKIIRRMYELYPDSQLPSLVALQLQLTDPLFPARLVDEARARLEEKLVQQATRDVVKDFELPHLQREKEELQNQLNNQSNTKIQQKLAKIEAEIASYDKEAPQLEDVLDEFLPEKLWSRDIDDIKRAIMNYANGKGSLNDISEAIKSTLKPAPESGALSGSDILQMNIRYHNAKYDDFDSWNLQEYISYIEQSLTSDNAPAFAAQMRRRLQSYGIDPLIINLVNILIEEEKISELSRVLDDFRHIMKIHRGEIDGVVTSARELSDEEFTSIVNALTKANPGKKITLTKSVEPGLLAGFVVKAGVQKFDFSLLAHIEKSRQAMHV